MATSREFTLKTERQFMSTEISNIKEYQKPEVKVISVTQSTPIAAGFELSIPGFGGDYWD